MTTKDALGARGLPALATGLMLVAGVVVGVAIATQSLETRRMINAVGGLLWLGGAAVLIRSLWESSRRAVAAETCRGCCDQGLSERQKSRRCRALQK